MFTPHNRKQTIQFWQHSILAELFCVTSWQPFTSTAGQRFLSPRRGGTERSSESCQGHTTRRWQSYTSRYWLPALLQHGHYRESHATALTGPGATRRHAKPTPRFWAPTGLLRTRGESSTTRPQPHSCRGKAVRAALRNPVPLAESHPSLIQAEETAERHRNAAQGHAAFICSFFSPVAKPNASTGHQKE